MFTGFLFLFHNFFNDFFFVFFSFFFDFFRFNYCFNWFVCFFCRYFLNRCIFFSFRFCSCHINGGIDTIIQTFHHFIRNEVIIFSHCLTAKSFELTMACRNSFFCLCLCFFNLTGIFTTQILKSDFFSACFCFCNHRIIIHAHIFNITACLNIDVAVDQLDSKSCILTALADRK